MTLCQDYDSAHSLSIARGGFVFTYCGAFYHVPAMLIRMAEECGMTLVCAC